MSEAPITREEMVDLFGDAIPMEVVALLWDAPDSMTIGQIRASMREIAASRKTLLERLRSEAANWSATCGDLFGEAADEIERLQQRLMTVECELNAASDGKYLPQG